jgi:molecular chaperone DnaK (HSP70)
MRRAAQNAGIVTPLTSSQLQLRSEPEAAAVSLLQEHRLHLDQHDSMLLIDAGGGTVDLSLHEVTAAASSSSSSYRLKELVPCTAELAGASFVDTAFTAYLLQKTGLSQQQWQDWKSRNQIRSQRLMTNEWETVKRAFGSSRMQDIEIELPQNLISVLPEQFQEQLEANENMLRIPADDVRRELFDPCIAKIISGAQKMLAVVGSADYILLAGGFSESPYLRSELERALKNRATKGFWTCSNGGSAVLKGEWLSWACTSTGTCLEANCFAWSLSHPMLPTCWACNAAAAAVTDRPGLLSR